MYASTRSLRMFLDTLIALQQQQLACVLNRWRPMFCRMCSFIFLHKSQKPQMISLGMYCAAIICLSTKVRWTYRVGGKIYFYFKVEKILKGSLDSIPSPSPSAKIQIMGGKVFLRCKGKSLLVIFNKLLKTKSLLTSPSNVLPYYLK